MKIRTNKIKNYEKLESKSLKFATNHVWVFVRVGDTDVGQLDVEELVDGVQCAADAITTTETTITGLTTTLESTEHTSS